jgi:N-dimethylarginine dimethylaminohydrolase
MSRPQKVNSSAYGGGKWSPRSKTHRAEIGDLWSNCGVNSEWNPLKHVLLHPPGPEIESISNPDAVQMLEVPNWKLARKQHENLSKKYQDLGVKVTHVNPENPPSPNQIFCADLFFMTPEGAIISRPASTVRAGEERWVARRLGNLGIPILKTLQGTAVFEGADAAWINDKTVLMGRGLRTNEIAITQIVQVLNEMGVKVIPIDLPIGTMHLMGILRFLDENLALVWPYRLAWKAIEALKENGFQILFIPDEDESTHNSALNFVTLGPRKILMSAGNQNTQQFLENHQVTCHNVKMDELQKAAGGIGCLSGIIERELIGFPEN